MVLPAWLGRDREATARISTLERRVKLRQVDVNRHMNQASYAEEFEWGRLDLLIRSRAWESWRRHGVNVVVADQHIVYRRELAPWARFRTDTRAVRVDGRLLCFEGHLLVGDRVHARGEARLLFVGRGGVLPPEQVPPLVERFLVPPLPVTDWTVAQVPSAP